MLRHKRIHNGDTETHGPCELPAHAAVSPCLRCEKSSGRAKSFLTRAALAVLATAGLAGTANAADSADSLLRHTAPHKWIEPFIPEKLPELKLPAFYTDLEKAQAQAFHGRYKQALITLAKVKP